MKTLDYLGLDLKSSQKTVDLLQELLANLQIHYANLRGFHWNVKGEMFFDAHVRFEEYYDDTAEKVDEVAERILMLGGTPVHNYSDYLKRSAIKESNVVSNPTEIQKLILDSLKTLISIERKVLAIASDGDDEGTVALMSDFISSQEKNVWMLVATLS